MKKVNRPEAFNHFEGSKAGSVFFSMECNEIDDRKTIHLDAFHGTNMPYGHIDVGSARRLRDWLTKSIKWLESE